MSSHVRARAPRPHRGWHDRGYLPHFDVGVVVQTVTFRLADSLPREFYGKTAVIASSHTDRFYALEKAIDKGAGGCLLTKTDCSEIVRDALARFDGERYLLLAWVIMPNHVHIMIEQMSGFRLADVVQSWKSFTAHAINKVRGSHGSVWAPEYFDRYVRDERHYANAKYYIENNPVKARLVGRPEDWPFSSATTRER